jgi:nucleoid-associated protein YgaU
MSVFDKLHEWFSRIISDHDDDCLTVTVGKGDSLSEIAEKRTGDANRWHEIADANPDREFDADYTLTIGETLRVPKSWGEG